jgi:hypothetical protein
VARQRPPRRCDICGAALRLTLAHLRASLRFNRTTFRAAAHCCGWGDAMATRHELRRAPSGKTYLWAVL